MVGQPLFFSLAVQSCSDAKGTLSYEAFAMLCLDQDKGNDAVILNADGVYVVTYSALRLNLKLIRNGYYESEDKSLPIAEVCSTGDCVT